MVPGVVAGAAGVVARAGAAGVVGRPAATGRGVPGGMRVSIAVGQRSNFEESFRSVTGPDPAVQAPWRDVDTASVRPARCGHPFSASSAMWTPLQCVQRMNRSNISAGGPLGWSPKMLSSCAHMWVARAALSIRAASWWRAGSQGHGLSQERQRQDGRWGTWSVATPSVCARTFTRSTTEPWVCHR